MLSAEEKLARKFRTLPQLESFSDPRKQPSAELPAEHPAELGSAEYIPSPAEIKAACAEIQSGWSDSERRKRESQSDTSGFRGAIRVYRLALGDVVRPYDAD